MKIGKRRSAGLTLAVASVAALAFVQSASTQDDWIKIGVNLGAPSIRLAVAELAPKSVEQQLVSMTQIFNTTLRNDLENAGIFELVSKSMMPERIPSEPAEVVFANWTDPPAAAQMLVFGKAESINQSLVISGRLFDVRSPTNPSVLGKRYVATMNEVATREAAHRFANEIIQTLGGGVPGIAMTKIAFVSKRTGSEEIWVMDYDGFNQRPITSYKSLSITPRWSPDNTRLAFTSYTSGNPEITMFSMVTNRRIPFPTYKGLNTTPAWSPDGTKVAFCSSMSGDPEIYVSDANGLNLQRLTFSTGVDISPVWNPKTGKEIAFVSDRSGTPQIYSMTSDGTNLHRLVSVGGDASSPSWSPNGLFIAYHWRVSETGTYDIYVIEIATGRIIQLTHDARRNEHPVWSPDGRHVAFESTRSGSRQIWSMLADGRDPRKLTQDGQNWGPNWSN
ncbi:MAG: Tol-Pal system beta propeller repeat protein TolB [Acidobacteria bacterium]|nr:Tol-Pal system beta propeller repeat protein TolB [Acidobacteriota bacterium]